MDPYMKTMWFDVEVKRKHTVIAIIRIQARNKGEAQGIATKQYLDHTLSFKAFNVSKEQHGGNVQH